MFKRYFFYLVPYCIAIAAAAVFARTIILGTSGVVPISEASTTTAALSSTAVIVAATTTVTTATTTANTNDGIAALPAPPARLSIPALKINASVQDVGITAGGAMGVPSNFTDVAWYKYSSLPGTKGNIVIDGHLDDGPSLAGVFKHLADLQTGDDIYVTTKDGQRIGYTVTSVTDYPFDSVPMAALIQLSGPPQLELITCGGTWLPDEETYSERVVVTASLQSNK